MGFEPVPTGAALILQQLIVEGDVGVGAALQVLEIGEGAGWLQLVVHEDLRGDGFDEGR